MNNRQLSEITADYAENFCFEKVFLKLKYWKLRCKLGRNQEISVKIRCYDARMYSSTD